MNKRILLAGCGYVGESLAQRLSPQGCEIFALTRNETQCKRLEKLGLNVVCDDLDSTTWHDKIQGDFEVVVNTVSSASRGPEGYIKSYINGQRSLLKWCAQRKVKTYCYTSATSVYPQSDEHWVGEGNLPEEFSSNGEFLRTAELLIEENGDLFDSWFIFRLAGIYGPGRHLLYDKVLKETSTLAGRGDTYLNLIHLRDIVDAICLAIKEGNKELSGIYNLSDGNPEKKQDILNWTAKQMGLIPPVYDPNQESPRGKNRQVGGQLPNRKISSEKFKKAFNWKPFYESYQIAYGEWIEEWKQSSY